MNHDDGEPVRLTRDDAAAAAAMLGRAFCDYPLFRYAIPDPAARQRLLPRCMAPMLHYGADCGQLRATSERLEGVALWLPPGCAEPSPWKLIRTGFFGTLLSLGPRACWRAARVMRHISRLKRQYAPNPHWYLQVLGTDPDHQGQGHAGRLIHAMLRRLDREKITCCLDTETEQNAAYYERFGFRTTGKGALPNSGITVWIMARESGST